MSKREITTLQTYRVSYLSEQIKITDRIGKSQFCQLNRLRILLIRKQCEFIVIRIFYFIMLHANLIVLINYPASLLMVLSVKCNK